MSSLGPEDRRKGFGYGNALQRQTGHSRDIQEIGNRSRAGGAAEWTGFKIGVRAAMVMQMHRHSRQAGGT